MSAADHAVIVAAAKSVGVADGALVRECAVRFAAQVAREVESGALKLRRRSGKAAVVLDVADGAGAVAGLQSPASPPSRAAGRRSLADAGVARAVAFRRASGVLP